MGKFKMNNVLKTIQWCDKSWNPITGCKRGCPWCYARKIHERFNTTPYSKIQFHKERLNQPIKVKKPSRIFVGSMSDIEYWKTEDAKKVIEIIKQCPQHTFMFLTKNPLGYKKIRKYPKNCWLGVTVTQANWDWYKICQMIWLKRNNLKFVSIEPILNEIDSSYFWLLDWVILGGLTPKPVHKQKWIKDFLSIGTNLKTPVFMKPNLKWKGKMRQEFPC